MKHLRNHKQKLLPTEKVNSKVEFQSRKAEKEANIID